MLASKKLAMAVFAGLVTCLIPTTIFKNSASFLIPVSRVLLFVLTANLMLCTLRSWKRLRLSVIMIHTGCVLVLLGGLLSSLGHISTINIYEHDSSNSAYRWDLGRDAELGFQITIKKINHQYYPTLLKIGVLEEGNKNGLFELKTGDSFQYGKYNIKIKSFDLELHSLELLVSTADGTGYTYKTTPSPLHSRSESLAFQLVAFKNPTLKRTWVDLEIKEQGKPAVHGSSEVNRPLTWNGFKIYHTSSGKDQSGNPYAGIQIVKDPGIWLVYPGFMFILLGGWMLIFKKSNLRI